jgi:hypothetical protein
MRRLSVEETLFGLVEGKKYVWFGSKNMALTPPIEFLGYQMYQTDGTGIGINFRGYWWNLYNIKGEELGAIVIEDRHFATED